MFFKSSSLVLPPAKSSNFLSVQLIINCADKKFDDFAGGKKNDEDLRNILNI